MLYNRLLAGLFILSCLASISNVVVASHSNKCAEEVHKNTAEHTCENPEVCMVCQMSSNGQALGLSEGAARTLALLGYKLSRLEEKKITFEHEEEMERLRQSEDARNFSNNCVKVPFFIGVGSVVSYMIYKAVKG